MQALHQDILLPQRGSTGSCSEASHQYLEDDRLLLLWDVGVIPADASTEELTVSDALVGQLHKRLRSQACHIDLAATSACGHGLPASQHADEASIADTSLHPMNKDSLPPAGKQSRRKWSLRRQLTTEGLLRSRKSPSILLQRSQMESCQVCRGQLSEMFIVGDHRGSCTINIPVPRRYVPVDGPACEQPPGNVGSLSLWHSSCVSTCTVLHGEHSPASCNPKHR